MIIYLILIILFLFILSYIFSLYLYRIVIDNRPTKFKPIGSSKYESITDHSLADEKWVLNNFKDVYLNSFDNLKLHGYELNKGYDNYVVLVHGYRGQGLNLAKVAKKFYSLGYNILIIDLRGHGKSSGNYIGMGYHDHFDLLTWLKYIKKNHFQAKVILYGISMGASTVLMTSGENPSNLKMTIADAGYESIWDEFKYQFHGLFHLPIFPFLYLTSFITKLKNHYSFHDGNTLDYVKKAQTPILFIHGSLDNFILLKNTQDMYQVVKSPKELLIVSKALHVASGAVDPKKYWETITKFIAKHIM